MEKVSDSSAGLLICQLEWAYAGWEWIRNEFEIKYVLFLLRNVSNSPTYNHTSVMMISKVVSYTVFMNYA